MHPNRTSMGNRSSFPLTSFLINVISLIINIIGSIITIFVLTYILLRRKTLRDIKLLLCTNNYILLFALGILTCAMNIRVLRGDLRLSNNEEETLGCRVLSYILYTFVSAVYQAFALQAFFRLCRIVYTTRRWLFQYHTYWIVIPLLWIFSWIFNSPLFIWHSQQLIPGEHACFVSKDDSRGVAYSILSVYGVPFICVALIYLQVTRFLRQQTIRGNLSVIAGHRYRDVIVLRRIIIIVILLGSYGMPTSIMLIMLAFTHELAPCFYRIIVLSIAACVLTLSIALIYVTPQIRTELGIGRRQTRIIPRVAVPSVLQLRPVEHIHKTTPIQILQKRPRDTVA